MRLWIQSDLHCNSLGEVAAAMADGPEHDVAVLAGDVCAGARRTIEALDTAAERPVVYVAGNHESYHRTLDVELTQAADASRLAARVRYLEQSSWTHRDVRFLGATLWSDFSIHGFDSRDMAMRHAAEHSNDFELIMARERTPLDLSIRSHVFQPKDAKRIFDNTVAWLEARFAEPHDGPTVVVTHHAPSKGSIAPRFRGDPLTPAYVSDLSARIERWQPTLWIHGHTHSRFDYRIGNTRIVCNPMGLFQGVDAEDTGYDAHLVVEI